MDPDGAGVEPTGVAGPGPAEPQPDPSRFAVASGSPRPPGRLYHGPCLNVAHFLWGCP